VITVDIIIRLMLSNLTRPGQFITVVTHTQINLLCANFLKSKVIFMCETENSSNTKNYTLPEI
jgi:hypothetical protein